MVEITYKRKVKPDSDYNSTLAMLQALDAPTIRAICSLLNIPYLIQTSPRLIAKRLQTKPETSRVIDSILRQPVKVIPDTYNAEQIIAEVVMAIAVAKGIEPEEVNIPRAIPTCFGFNEAIDPACVDCVYNVHCAQFTTDLRPKCFGLLHNKESVACNLCLYNPWCKCDIEP